LNKTRDLVSQRENLRYERTRAYGMVRKMFFYMGKRFFEQNLILHQRDIFYLTKEEIFAQISGTAITQDLKALIALRKKEFENYNNDRQPSERFATYDMVYANNDFFDTSKNIELPTQENGKTGIGECGILRTLSFDDRPDYEEKLQWVCQNIHLGKDKLWDELMEFPSIQFGVEMAFLSLASKTPFDLFPSEFTKGKKNMLINGLVWMGEESFMKTQIEEKLAQGFSCIKLKIGAIDFEKELGLLRFIRQNFDAKTIEIRVDANGAFGLNEALNKLNQLSEFELHSIEQPIQKNSTDKMSELCKTTSFPIALDEELIGVFKSSFSSLVSVIKSASSSGYL
jgi:hypothetical protein